MTDKKTGTDREALRDKVIGVRTALALAVTAVVVLAVLAAFLVRASSIAADHRSVSGDRAELRSVAASIVSEVLSVDAADDDADRARAKDAVGGDFAAGNADILSSPVPPGVESIVWRPVRTALTASGKGWGEALLAFEVTTTPVAGEPVTTRRTLAAHFEKADGRWLLTRTDVTA